jgi:hypothetical protein
LTPESDEDWSVLLRETEQDQEQLEEQEPDYQDLIDKIIAKCKAKGDLEHDEVDDLYLAGKGGDLLKNLKEENLMS